VFPTKLDNKGEQRVNGKNCGTEKKKDFLKIKNMDTV
jgi:hypothetical protein